MTARIEENEEGELVLVLPEDIIEEYCLDIGHKCTWTIEEDGTVLLSF